MPSREWLLDPRLADDSHPLAQLDLSELRLFDDGNYPWLLLVPRVVDARELIDLSASQQRVLLAEIDHCSRVLLALFAPDKLNVAALGNRVEQLHVHLIARYHDDPAWPDPVWGHGPPRRYSPEALVERVERLHPVLHERRRPT